MTDVKIGVQADVAGAASGIKKVEAATAGLEKRLDGVGKTAARAAEQVAKLEAIASRLSRAFGRPVDDVSAAMFNSRFENMRGGGGFGSRRLKQFGSFEDWDDNHSATFQRQADAQRHRQFILAAGMRGTPFAANGGGGGSGAAGGGAGGGGGGFGGFSGAGGFASGAGSLAMGVLKGGLALAGIGSISSIIKSGFDSYKSEALSIDTTTRLVGGAFGELIQKTRDATAGMGLAFKESAALAEQLAKTTGNLKNTGDFQAGIGLARSLGLEPGAGVDLLGTSRRMGAIGGEPEGEKRFAYMIAQAIERSGYAGQAGEIVGAIKSFTENFSRRNLSAAPIDAFAGALAGLTKTGVPGLDPTGAASILNSADAAVRGGGGGKWGQMFLMQSLMGKGNNPYAAQYLWEQGLFGSSASTFAPGSPMAAMLGKFGATGIPALTGDMNFAKIRDRFDQSMKGMGWAAPGAFGQLFGLNAAQGAALHEMTPEAFQSLQDALKGTGINPADVSATGFANIARISRAGFGELGDIGDSYAGKLSDDEKRKLASVEGGHDIGALRSVLVEIAARHGQEDTPGSNLRQMAATLDSMKDILGEGVAKPLEFLAEAAGWDKGGVKAAANAAAVAAMQKASGEYGGLGEFDIGARPGAKSTVAGWSKAFDSTFLGLGPDAALAKAIAANESGLNPLAKSRTSSATGLFQFINSTWDKFGDGGNPRNADDSTAAFGREIQRFRSLGAHKDTELAMGHHYGEGHIFDPPDALAKKEAAEASAARAAGYGAVDVNIKINGKDAQSIRAPMSQSAPAPAGGPPIAWSP